MKSRPGASWPVLSALAMTLLIAGAAAAQGTTATQTSEVIKFEVISVDGNTLVVTDETGAREVTVPDDFRFTVDGKSMSVHELTPGMKGTAQVTTTTVVRPVNVTTVRKGTVVKRVRDAVYVKVEDGSTRKFTKSELEQRGIKIIMEGKPVRLADLKGGDMLTATIVTSAPPEVLTSKDVQAVLDIPEPTAAEVAAEETVNCGCSLKRPLRRRLSQRRLRRCLRQRVPRWLRQRKSRERLKTSPIERWIWIALAAIVAIGAFLLMRRKKT